MSLLETKRRLTDARSKVAGIQSQIMDEIEKTGNTSADLVRSRDKAQSEVDRLTSLWEDGMLAAANSGRGIEGVDHDPDEPRHGSSADQGRAHTNIATAEKRGLIPTAAAEIATRLVANAADKQGIGARWAATTGDPNYSGAFAKLIADPQRGHMLWSEQERRAFKAVEEFRAMSLTDNAGGYMVPFHLDPAILLTNAGSINPMRQISRTVTTATDSWNGISSAGATSEWLAEATEAADGSPVLAQPSIPIHKFACDVPFSYEVGMDGANFLQELQEVMVDSVDVLQALAFINGTGTGQPTGIITALDGGTSEVTPTTTEVFAAADVLKTQNALPARFSARAQWIAQISTINQASSFETTNGALRFPEIADGRLLRKPLHEASQMDAYADIVITETDGNNHILLYGDFNNYVIADRIGATFEVLPGYGANQRPSGQRHAFLWGRVGADSVIDAAFRVLHIPTTA